MWRMWVHCALCNLRLRHTRTISDTDDPAGRQTCGNAAPIQRESEWTVWLAASPSSSIPSFYIHCSHCRNRESRCLLYIVVPLKYVRLSLFPSLSTSVHYISLNFSSVRFGSVRFDSVRRWFMILLCNLINGILPFGIAVVLFNSTSLPTLSSPILLQPFQSIICCCFCCGCRWCSLCCKAGNSLTSACHNKALTATTRTIT